MVSLPISVDDLDDLPDLTSRLEDLDSKPVVDTILPRYLGNGELGRFVLGFTLISGRTVQFHSLLEKPSGYGFEKVYDFTASNEIESWGTLWEGGVFFQWADRDQALALRACELVYGGQFTLGRPIPEIDDMVAFAKEHLSITSPPQLITCNHEDHDTRYEDVPRLPLQLELCSECGMPGAARYHQTTVGRWDTFIDNPWGDFSESTVFEKGEYTFISKDSESPTTATDIAVHLLSRVANIEYEPIDYYLGDYNTVAILTDNTIVGYLTWNQLGGRTLLQVVYILPEYRGKGLASELVEAWYENVCPTESYYANEPNDRGIELLESLGHLGNSGIAKAVRMHSTAEEVDDPSKLTSGNRLS